MILSDFGPGVKGLERINRQGVVMAGKHYKVVVPHGDIATDDVVAGAPDQNWDYGELLTATDCTDGKGWVTCVC